MSCVAASVLLATLIALSATWFASQWLLPILGSIVLLAVFVLLADLRRRHSRLNHQLEKTQHAVGLMSKRSDSRADAQRELRGVEQRLDVRVADLEYVVQRGFAGHTHSSESLSDVSNVTLVVVVGQGLGTSCHRYDRRCLH